jgi:hypothetical protein
MGNGFVCSIGFTFCAFEAGGFMTVFWGWVEEWVIVARG